MVGSGGQDFDGEGATGEAGTSFAGVDLPKARELTSEEKVLAALRDKSDPMYVDMVDAGDEIEPDDIDYVERGQLQAAWGVAESTFANVLNKLEKKGDPPDQGRENLEGGPGQPTGGDQRQGCLTERRAPRRGPLSPGSSCSPARELVWAPDRRRCPLRCRQMTWWTSQEMPLEIPSESAPPKIIANLYGTAPTLFPARSTT
ncbi:hypothetical protein [Streptomyces subrutilus]|uniref:hypothetical protein n=1 Tax=Streptomyces subrutilus TaxID=36818 RepID=UPI00340376D7